MQKKSVSKKDIENLFEVIVKINSVKDCKTLFEDLCTDKEIEQMAQRIKAAKLLIDGNTYNQVIEQTDISSATLCRVSRCVQYGKGYKNFVK
ncbi:MAG: TrpR-related protein YerC/YecD [Clostridia bacterium]|nr:TrpR-related protein YerC/YecD [Clostridia bacterium]